MDGRVHHWRPALVVFNFFWFWMILQVIVIYHLMDKSYITVTFFIIQGFLDFPVVFWKWLGKTHVEVKVREIFFYIFEMRHVEEFFLRSPTVPIGYFSARFFSVEEVENMRSQRRHTCTTANIYHFAVCRIDVEFSIRSGNIHLIAGLSREYKRRTYPRVNVHPTIVGPIPWRSSNPNGQHDDVSFSRVVRH